MVPADVVIAVVPALFSGAVAQLVRHRFGARVGVIVQDVMSAAALQSGIAGGGSVAALARHTESWALRSADSVVTIHPKLSEVLHKTLNLSERPRVIHNWSHVSVAGVDESAAMRTRRRWDDHIVVLHSGNMGLKQDLLNVAAAAKLAEVRGSRVQFVLTGGGSQFNALKSLASGVHNLSVEPGVPDSEFPALLGAADFLLVNERAGMHTMSLPSKLTSYLAAGRPVVVATDNASATAAFIRRTSAGVVVPAGDASSLLDAVEGLARDKDRAAKLGANGKRFADTELTSGAALAEYDAWVHELATRGGTLGSG